MADEEGGTTVVVVTANDIESSKVTDDSANMPTLETISTWSWPEYDVLYDMCGQKTRSKRKRSSSTDADNQEDKNDGLAPFHVVYHCRKGVPWAERVKVTINSRVLLETLCEFIPDGDFNSLDVAKKPKVWVKELFHIRKKLQEKYAKLCSDDQEAAAASNNDHGLEGQLRNCLRKDDNELLRVHLGVLLQFINKEFEGPVASYSAMKEQGRVSWDMVWAFFPPGEKVVYQCRVTDEEVCGLVQETVYETYCTSFNIHLAVWDYNGKTWDRYTALRSIDRYDGDCRFTDLQEICPLAFRENPVDTENAFLERGKKFCWLSMMGKERYMNYKGPIFISQEQHLGGGLVKENADGRVMVDLGSFARMNPTYDMGAAKPPPGAVRDKKVEAVDNSGSPTRMYAPAIVYGFSFRLKKWGTFSIMGFEHITFNDAAFDLLVMDPTRKELLYGLVGEYIKDPNLGHIGNQNNSEAAHGRVDPIAHKGEGCIILCYGPPGTGKTLTAESIAERLHCPLWSLSVSELGTNPSELESTLMKVLEVAASWRAVVLLDEADVYLERRTSSDLVRNAMTGVFLRQLEYYRGVLFLTTNRVVMFDDAFCSRISMFVHYEKHDKETRATIWRTLLQRLRCNNVQEVFHTADLDELSAEFSEADFNGREIRNIVQTAMTLARSTGETLQAKHLRKALTAMVNSMKELKFVQSQMPMLLA